ncbi:MAG: hypothetical protein P5681_24875, partial [Limnospira sp. PMC 894.15]
RSSVGAGSPGSSVGAGSPGYMVVTDQSHKPAPAPAPALLGGVSTRLLGGVSTRLLGGVSTRPIGWRINPSLSRQHKYSDITR